MLYIWITAYRLKELQCWFTNKKTVDERTKCWNNSVVRQHHWRTWIGHVLVWDPVQTDVTSVGYIKKGNIPAFYPYKFGDVDENIKEKEREGKEAGGLIVSIRKVNVVLED